MWADAEGMAEARQVACANLRHVDLIWRAVGALESRGVWMDLP